MTDREYRDYIMFNGSNVIKHTNFFCNEEKHFIGKCKSFLTASIVN